MQDRPIEARPEEDKGRDTALWYDYQYCCTVRDCLAMMTSATPWVICEWHTDFICAGTDGNPPHCLVSVKHRKPDQGPWPISELARRGGLAILYKRWVESGRCHNCRWVTNGGLKLGDLQTRRLAALLSSRGPDFKSRITQYAEYLQGEIKADTRDDTERFLTSLSIFTTGGDAHSFRAQVIEDVARPILAQLGVRPGMAREAYKAAHGLVLDAVQGLDPSTCNVDWYSGDDSVSFDIVQRKITLERLLGRLAEHGIAIPREIISGSDGPQSAMVNKLRAGGLGPTIVGVAPRIRQRWYELEVCMRPDIPSPYGDELDRIRAEVAVCAGEAESRHRVAGTLYGVSMHRDLSEKLNDASRQGRRISLTQTELLGCAYQLTDECEIWWSDEFAPLTEAPWLESKGTADTAVSSSTTQGQGEFSFD